MSAEPLFTEPIYGIRCWQLHDSLCALRGIGRGRSEPWYPDGRWTKARCLTCRHPAPDPRCACGLYAYHPSAAPPSWCGSWGFASLAGLVEARGRVELHRHGFRAAEARPRIFFVPPRLLARPAYRARVERISRRAGADLVEVPLPEHALEWCEREGYCLAPEVVLDLVVGRQMTLFPPRRGDVRG